MHFRREERVMTAFLSLSGAAESCLLPFLCLHLLQLGVAPLQAGLSLSLLLLLRAAAGAVWWRWLRRCRSSATRRRAVALGLLVTAGALVALAALPPWPPCQLLPTPPGSGHQSWLLQGAGSGPGDCRGSRDRCRQRRPDGSSSHQSADSGGPATSQQVSELRPDRHQLSATQSTTLEAHHTTAYETHRPVNAVSANHAHHTTAYETHGPVNAVSANHAHHTTVNETHRPVNAVSANHAHHTTVNETHRPVNAVSANHAHHTTVNETHRPVNTVSSNQLLNSGEGLVPNSGQPPVTDDGGLSRPPEPWTEHASDEQTEESSGDWMVRPQHETVELPSQSELQHQSAPDDQQSDQWPGAPQYDTHWSPPQTSSPPLSNSPDASLLPPNEDPDPNLPHDQQDSELAVGHHWGATSSAGETSSGPAWTAAPPEPELGAAGTPAAPGQPAEAAPPAVVAPSGEAAAPVSLHHPHHQRQHDEAAAASHRPSPAVSDQSGDIVGEGGASPARLRPALSDTAADHSVSGPGGGTSSQQSAAGSGQHSPLPADGGVSAPGAQPRPAEAAADPPALPSDRGQSQTPQPPSCVELSQLEIPFDPLKYPDGVVICEPVTPQNSALHRADSASGGHQANYREPTNSEEHGSGRQSSVGQAGFSGSGPGTALTPERRRELQLMPVPAAPSPPVPRQHISRQQKTRPLMPAAKHNYADRRKQWHRHGEAAPNAGLGEWHDAAETETEINAIATAQYQPGRSRTAHTSRKFGGKAAASSNTRKHGTRLHQGRGRYLTATTKQPGGWGLSQAIRRLKELAPSLKRLLARRAEPVVSRRAEPVVRRRAEPVVRRRAEPVVRRRGEPVVRRRSRRRGVTRTGREARHRRSGRPRRSLTPPRHRRVVGYSTWLKSLSSALKLGVPKAGGPVAAAEARTEPAAMPEDIRRRGSLDSGSAHHASSQDSHHLERKPFQWQTSALDGSSLSLPNARNLSVQRWGRRGPAGELHQLSVSVGGEGGGRSSPSRRARHPSLSSAERLNRSDGMVVTRAGLGLSDVGSEATQVRPGLVGVGAQWRWPAPSVAPERPPRSRASIDRSGGPHPGQQLQRRVQAGGSAVYRLSPPPSRQQPYLAFLLTTSLLVLYGCLGAPHRHVVQQSWHLSLDDAEHLERQGRHLWAAELTSGCVLAASAALLAAVPECLGGRRPLAGLLAVAAALCLPALCLLPWLPLVGGKAPPPRLRPAVSALTSSRRWLLFVTAVFSVGAMSSAEFNFLLPFCAARRPPATFVFLLAAAVALVSRLPVRAVHGRLVSRIGSVGTVVLSFSALTARCLCYLCLPTQWGLLPAQLLSGLTETLFWHGLLVFVEENARSGDVVERTTLRLLDAVYTAGRCTGAALAGFCFTMLGGTATFALLATASAGGALGYYVLASCPRRAPPSQHPRPP